MESARAPIRDVILMALRDHPLLSRRQLELYLGRSGRSVRFGLADLKKRKWVWRANARQPALHTRSLFALTTAGITELARQADSSVAEYTAQYWLGSERLERMALLMERVFQLRTLFLWLSPLPDHSTVQRGGRTRKAKQGQSVQPKSDTSKNKALQWRATTWDVEVGKLFNAKGHAAWLPFHGAALMQRGLAPSDAQSVSVASSKAVHWAFVVVEFDLRRVSVERERARFAQFVAAQDDPRYWGKDKEQFFPILLIIAQDELRLQDYYNVLRSAALARQLPMPRAYLTTFDEMLSLRGDPTLPIWYSTISGRRVSLLFDTEGVTTPLPERVPWRKLPVNPGNGANNKNATLAPNASAGVASEILLPNEKVTETDGPKNTDENIQSEFARIALSLRPLAKRLLDEIAAHPLLTRQELGLLFQAPLRRVQPALEKLTTLQLIETHDAKYLITPKGQHYLALVAGFGNAVMRYARARGWGKGFNVLLRRWEHTQQENKFFLHLAKLARAHGHGLTWFSELESRLYYEAGQRHHSFLPDGRGTYLVGEERYEFALEIDRTNSAQERLRGKLAEFEACVSSNVLRREGIEFLRVLVVTKSWERADTWWRAAESAQIRFPLFITTFDRLYASKADAPIWLRGDHPKQDQSAAAASKTYCLECFAKIRKPR